MRCLRHCHEVLDILILSPSTVFHNCQYFLLIYIVLSKWIFYHDLAFHPLKNSLIIKLVILFIFTFFTLDTA